MKIVMSAGRDEKGKGRLAGTDGLVELRNKRVSRLSSRDLAAV